MAFEWQPLSEAGFRSIADSTARLNIWEGAVRSSKTICSIVRFIEAVKATPPGPIMMIGKTERTLKRNILDPMLKILGSGLMKTRYGNGEISVCGRTIYIAGANDERAEGKIRGITLALAYGDEFTLWPESFFRMLLSRLSVEGAQLFGTTNPDSPHHWLKKSYIDREDELNLKTFHFKLSDNLSLSEQYITDISAEYSGLWYRRYILGEWVSADGAVYDMFDPQDHVTDVLPAMSQWFTGIDYGTTNPAVFLLMGIGVDKRLYVVDEWRHDPSEHNGAQKTDAELSKAFIEWLRGHKVNDAIIKPRWNIVDPSAASFKAQLRADGVKSLANADNDVIDGIRRVSTLLTAGLLKIHPRCSGLIAEMSNYTWDTKATNRGEDKPTKTSDHGPDALRYLVNGTHYVWKAWTKAMFADVKNEEAA